LAKAEPVEAVEIVESVELVASVQETSVQPVIVADAVLPQSHIIPISDDASLGAIVETPSYVVQESTPQPQVVVAPTLQSASLETIESQANIVPAKVMSTSVQSAEIQKGYVDYIEASPAVIEYSQEPLNPVVYGDVSFDETASIDISEYAAANTGSSDELPVGVPINHVELGKFLQLSDQDGAKHYPSMNALLLNNELFLLSGT